MAKTLFQGEFFPAPFGLFLFQVCVILLTAQIFKKIVIKYLKQPGVVGEMIAGIVLGPTVLGRTDGFSAYIFPTTSIATISVVANFGLVFYMFIIGLELDTVTIRKNIRNTSIISFTGLVVPLAIGFPLASLFSSSDYSTVSPGVLGLYLGCVLGVTSVATLSRIFAEKKILSTPVGSLVLSVAALEYVVIWILLAGCNGLARASNANDIGYLVAIGVCDVLILYYLVRPFLTKMAINYAKNPKTVSVKLLSIFYILILSAYVCETVGFSSLIGALQIGLILPRDSAFRQLLLSKMESFLVAIFTPIYFAVSGIKTQLALINDGTSWGYLFIFLLVAYCTKVLGLGIPQKILLNQTPKQALGYGVLMTCKGLSTLIVVNFGADNNIVTPKLFAVLVVLTVLTTFITVPATNFLAPEILIPPPDVKRRPSMMAGMDEDEHENAHSPTVSGGTGAVTPPEIQMAPSTENLESLGHPTSSQQKLDRIKLEDADVEAP